MTSPLRGRAAFFYVLTVLSFLGTVIITTLLFTATTKVCDAVECQQVRVESWPAWVALITGLIQSVLLLTIGQLCSTVTQLVERVG